MPIAAIIAAVTAVASTAATIASSAEQFQSSGGASTEKLNSDKRAQLTAALVALETTNELIQEIKATIEQNQSLFSTGRDALSTALEQSFTGVGILLSQIESRIQALNVPGVGGVKGSDVDAVFGAAKDLFNQRPDDGSADEIRNSIQAHNLVSAGLLIDNLSKFSTVDLKINSDAQLTQLTINGSLMLRIQQIRRSVKAAD